jgi:hypothetical protein
VGLAGVPVRSGAVLAPITSGFGLTIVLYLLPDTPGDWAERLLPLAGAGVILLAGSARTADGGGDAVEEDVP